MVRRWTCATQHSLKNNHDNLDDETISLKLVSLMIMPIEVMIALGRT